MMPPSCDHGIIAALGENAISRGSPNHSRTEGMLALSRPSRKTDARCGPTSAPGPARMAFDGLISPFSWAFGHTARCAFSAIDRASNLYSRLMTKMVLGRMQGEPTEKNLTWAEIEVEGFMRT